MKAFSAPYSDFLISELSPEHRRVSSGQRCKAEIFLDVAIVFQAAFIPIYVALQAHTMVMSSTLI